MNPGKPLQIATDSALEPSDQLELPTQKPFGHFVAYAPGKEFVIVSEALGELCGLPEFAMAQPFLRMLAREAYLGHRRFDFRLYQWLPAAEAWDIAQRAIELHDVPVEPAAHKAELMTRTKQEQRDRDRVRRARDRYPDPTHFVDAEGHLARETD